MSTQYYRRQEKKNRSAWMTKYHPLTNFIFRANITRQFLQTTLFSFGTHGASSFHSRSMFYQLFLAPSVLDKCFGIWIKLLPRYNAFRFHSPIFWKGSSLVGGSSLFLPIFIWRKLLKTFYNGRKRRYWYMPHFAKKTAISQCMEVSKHFCWSYC